MKMYERFIPEPLTLEDFADHFKRNIGDLKKTDHRKMFCGWMKEKYRMIDLRDFFGFDSHSSIFYYLKQHSNLMETDDIYRRKFEQL